MFLPIIKTTISDSVHVEVEVGEVSDTRMAITEATTATATEDPSIGITLDEVASNEITPVIVSTL